MQDQKWPCLFLLLKQDCLKIYPDQASGSSLIVSMKGIVFR